MMKWRAIVGAVVLVGGFVALHFFFFGERMAEWKQLETDAQANVAEYRVVMGQTGVVDTFDGTAVTGWITRKNRELDKTKQEFQKIRDSYPRILLPAELSPDSYVKPLFEETVLHLNRLAELERNYAAGPNWPVDRIKILDDLDIGSSMVPGAPSCGFGFSSTGNRYPTYYFTQYMRDAGPSFPRQGAVEFWFKPDNWSTPDDARERTLFFARGDELRRAQTLEYEAGQTYYPQIHIVKDRQSYLRMTMTDVNGTEASTQGSLDGTIGFRPDQWAYVSCTWSGNQLNLYVNGQRVTNRQTQAPRETSIYDEFDGGMLGPGGGRGIRDRLRFLQQGQQYGVDPMAGLGVEKKKAPTGPFLGPGNLRFAQLGLGYGVTLSADPFANQADGTFDELRVKNIPDPSRPTASSGQQIPGTFFLDSFESEFPSGPELENTLVRIKTVLTSIRVSNDVEKSRPLIDELEMLKAACGMNKARLDTLDKSVRFIRRVHVFNSLAEITGWPLTDDGLFGAFSWLPAKDIDAPYETTRPAMPDMEAYVAFLKLAGELVDVAMSAPVGIAIISRVSFEGEDLVPGAEELDRIFQEKLAQLKAEFPNNHRGINFIPPADWEKWRDQLQSEAYIQPEIAELMMGGLGGMSATDYMGGAGGGMPTYDPAESERQMVEMEKKIQKWITDKDENLHKLEQYLGAAKSRTIPKEVRDDYRETRLAQGNVTYKKRLLRIDYLCNATALAKFIHEIEYGSHGRLANIENYSMQSDAHANLAVSMVVAFHQVKDAQPSTEQQLKQPPPQDAPKMAAAAPAGVPPAAIPQ